MQGENTNGQSFRWSMDPASILPSKSTTGHQPISLMDPACSTSCLEQVHNMCQRELVANRTTSCTWVDIHLVSPGGFSVSFRSSDLPDSHHWGHPGRSPYLLVSLEGPWWNFQVPHGLIQGSNPQSSWSLHVPRCFVGDFNPKLFGFSTAAKTFDYMYHMHPYASGFSHEIYLVMYPRLKSGHVHRSDQPWSNYQNSVLLCSTCVSNQQVPHSLESLVAYRYDTL